MGSHTASLHAHFTFKSNQQSFYFFNILNFPSVSDPQLGLTPRAEHPGAALRNQAVLFYSPNCGPCSYPGPGAGHILGLISAEDRWPTTVAVLGGLPRAPSLGVTVVAMAALGAAQVPVLMTALPQRKHLPPTHTNTHTHTTVHLTPQLHAGLYYDLGTRPHWAQGTVIRLPGAGMSVGGSVVTQVRQGLVYSEV